MHSPILPSLYIICPPPSSSFVWGVGKRDYYLLHIAKKERGRRAQREVGEREVREGTGG